MTSPPPMSPVTMSVIAAVGAIMLVVFIALAIGVSYILTLHAIDVTQTNALHQAVLEHAAACKQLVDLDNAKNGIAFSAPTKTGTAELYILRFVRALHALVVQQGCS